MNPNESFEGAEEIFTEDEDITPLVLRKIMWMDLDYISTPISSVLHNESDIRIAFGFANMLDREVIVLEYLEERRQFFEVCREEITNRVYQSEWIPYHPQLLAVASSQIKIYDYQERNLNLRSTLLPEVHFNPIIYMDWNRLDPNIMLATSKNGKLTVMHMEYGSNLAEMMTRISPSVPLSKPGFCARFGGGPMENCVVTINRNKDMIVFDDTLQRVKIYECINGILDIEFAKHHEFIVACRTENEVFLQDLRFLTMNRKIYCRFDDNEVPKCFFWSSNSPALYIGTSKGRIIEWNTERPEIGQRYTNVGQKSILNIHVSEDMPNLLFAASVGLSQATLATQLAQVTLATQLEAYSILS